MKKLKLFLSAFLLMGLTLGSCSDDDDNTPVGPITTGEIMAKWNPVKTVIKIGSGADSEVLYEDSEPDCASDYIQFAAANVLNRATYYKDVNNICQESLVADPGTWAKNGTTLTINGDDFYTGTYEILTLSNTDLVVKRTTVNSGITTTYTTYFTKAPTS